MANEITTLCQLGVLNGRLSIPSVGTSVMVTQATARGGNPGTVDLSTVEGAISFGDTVPGYVYLRNLDATNYVEFGPEAGGVMVPCLKLKAGEQALIRLAAGVVLRGRVDQTAYALTAVKVLIMAVND